MAFTTAELNNIAAQSLDYHKRNKIHLQNIKDKPLFDFLRSKSKPFPGGKDYITERVKGVTTPDIMGFTHNDTVTFSNPANVKVAQVAWKELHIGIGLFITELKKNGITVVDSNSLERTQMADEREKIALSNLLDDKLQEMSEGYADGFDDMLHEDGTQDAKEVAGIKSFIVDNPAAVGTILGIDQVANAWWRNRSLVDNSGGTGTDDRINVSAGVPADQILITALNKEWRQLSKFGAKPDFAICGSDFLDVLEAEQRAKGVWTQSGWATSNGFDLAISDPRMGKTKFRYDPKLDDMSESKRCYVIASRDVQLYHMSGEEDKVHNPAPPHDQYVLYKGMTWTGGLMCTRRNGCGVYEFK